MYQIVVYHFSRRELEEKDQDLFEDLTENEGWVSDIEDIEMALGHISVDIQSERFELPVSALDILESKWEARFDSGICVSPAVYHFPAKDLAGIREDLSANGTRSAVALAEYLKNIPDTDIVVIDI